MGAEDPAYGVRRIPAQEADSLLPIGALSAARRGTERENHLEGFRGARQDQRSAEFDNAGPQVGCVVGWARERNVQSPQHGGDCGRSITREMVVVQTLPANLASRRASRQGSGARIGG